MHPLFDKFIASSALALLLTLAACGGASDMNSAAEADQSGASAGASSTTMRTAGLPASEAVQTWTQCAAENGTCTFTGTHDVRYGAGERLVQRAFDGGAACTNGTFGDPAVGTVKACWVGDTVWQRCAGENGQCSFAGTHEVRYGTLSAYVGKAAVNAGITCDNATFGDPAVGTVKSCWYALRTVVAATDPCQALPPLPSLPANHKLVTSFCKNGHCATPDDGIDATDAIDEALNQSANSVLVFPPGRYLISRSLRIKQPGVTLWGPGATIHATNWDDQSIIVEADNASIYSFTLTAVTNQRGSRAEHTRIAIYGPAGVNPIVKNTVIMNNRIVNAGDPGTPLANSATGAGIFVNAADGFLIAGNTVVRSLADGIHITGGARNGRVLGNTVRETGDDMIAVVSYAYPDPYANTAATILPNFAANAEIYQSRDILIADNALSGQYWGRGIAVVGGRGITIRGNTLRNVPYAAGILLARETSSGTYGVDNVLVEGNSITDEQTLSPPYDFGGKFAAASRTGHGAIEVNASMFFDELQSPVLTAGFTVGNLTLRNNTVTTSATPGVRIGAGNGSNWTMGTRPVTGSAPLSKIGIGGNTMGDIRTDQAIQVLANDGVASCSANTRDGAALGAARCTSVALIPVAAGASLSCPVSPNTRKVIAPAAR